MNEDNNSRRFDASGDTDDDDAASEESQKSGRDLLAILRDDDQDLADAKLQANGVDFPHNGKSSGDADDAGADCADGGAAGSSSDESLQSGRDLLTILRDDDQVLADAKLRAVHGGVTHGNNTSTPDTLDVHTLQQQGSYRDVLTILQDDDKDLAEAKLKALQGGELDESAITRTKSETGALNPTKHPLQQQQGSSGRDLLCILREDNQDLAAAKLGAEGFCTATPNSNKPEDKLKTQEPKDIPEEERLLPDTNISTLDDESTPQQQQLPPPPGMMRLSRGTNVQQQAAPGAYRFRPPTGPTGTLTDANNLSHLIFATDSDNSASPSNSSRSFTQSNTLHRTATNPTILGTASLAGLIVAQPVMDEEMNFPQAHQFDNDNKNEVLEEQRNMFKQKIRFCIACVLIFVTVAALMIGLLIRKDNNQQSTSVVTNSTLAPSMAPTLSLDAYVLRLLPTPTQTKILQQPTSSQAMAYQWLLEDSPLPFYTNERIMQRFALVTFYYATNGDSWFNNTFWLNHDTHECDWYSLSSPAFMIEMLDMDVNSALFANNEAGSCEGTDTYRHLWIFDNGLAGIIPDELWLLTTLTSMALQNNDALSTGGRAFGIRNLVKLEILDLRFIDFGGSLPSEIGECRNLTKISITGANLQGTIPTQIGNLKKLKVISLDDNPSITGILPSELGLLGDSLQSFSFGGTSLLSTIPTEYGLLQSLNYLDLTFIDIRGTIPSELGQLTGLSSFLLSSWFSDEFGLLVGTIPSEIGLLASLDYLDLEGNQFTGPIPTEIGLMTRLRSLSLPFNQLSGSIPSELSNILVLKYIQFQQNDLSGTIPTELERIAPRMDVMNVSGNSLTGFIPPTLCGISVQYHMTQIIDFDCSDALCGCSCPCWENASGIAS